MRKVLTSIFMLLYVFIVWGQTGEPVDSIKKKFSYFKESMYEVIAQGEESQDFTFDETNFKAELNSILCNVDSILSIYEEFNEEDSFPNGAIELIGEFIEEYDAAILSKDRTSIKIGSNKFYNVVIEYSPKLRKVYNNVNQWRNKLKKDEDPPKEKDDQKGMQIPGWFWLVMGIGILGFILAFLSVIMCIRINSCIKHRLEQIEELGQKISKLSQDLAEIKPTHYRTPIQTSVGQSNDTLQYQPKQSARQSSTVSVAPVIVPRSNRDEDKTQLVPEQKTTITNLYATTKAHFHRAEFFKVSQENTGDKVYMLTLANPEADTADFTIVPNMTEDFMNSVIKDRDTYMPPPFCEKSIDTQNPSKIEVLSQGKAKKVDGRWQVQERMSIRLI